VGALTFGILTAVVAFFFAFGQQVLGLFGSEYVAAFDLLRLIALSSFLYAGYVFFTIILNMKMRTNYILLLNVMILILIVLMLLSFGVSTLSELIPAIKIPLNDMYLHETLLWQIGAFLLPIGFNFLMFWALYYWIPTVKVSQKASILGGLVAGVAWALLNNAFPGT